MEVRQSDCYIPDPKGWVDAPAMHNGPVVNQDAPVVKIFHVFEVVATGASEIRV